MILRVWAKLLPPISRAARSAAESLVAMSSPSTMAMRGARKPTERAISAMRCAAAGGLAAPKLPTILMPDARHCAKTGRRIVERGTVAALRISAALELAQRERPLCQRLEHQKARSGLRGESIHHGTAGIRAVARKSSRRADENLCHGAMLSAPVHRVKRSGRDASHGAVSPSAPSPHPLNCAA